ncbi:hypothetical protein CYY_005904 [Polysphondylium violaceum]|uniref:Uncharacterized protein n=1 Tax=Polysphondylium violaceum TaxID=133409 RepID=A0A8J4URV4_9MYCE|nr:hypothetical protein CYY_005904 [Polysphondylium violaceum]
MKSILLVLAILVALSVAQNYDCPYSNIPPNAANPTHSSVTLTVQLCWDDINTCSLVNLADGNGLNMVPGQAPVKVFITPQATRYAYFIFTGSEICVSHSLYKNTVNCGVSNTLECKLECISASLLYKSVLYTTAYGDKCSVNWNDHMILSWKAVPLTNGTTSSTETTKGSSTGGNSTSTTGSVTTGGNSTTSETTRGGTGNSTSTTGSFTTGGNSTTSETTKGSTGNSTSSTGSVTTGGNSTTSETTRGGTGNSTSTTGSFTTGGNSTTSETTKGSTGNSTSSTGSVTTGGESTGNSTSSITSGSEGSGNSTSSTGTGSGSGNSTSSTGTGSGSGSSTREYVPPVVTIDPSSSSILSISASLFIFNLFALYLLI